MNEELKNLLEGIETANSIKQYDEGLADVVKGAGRAIVNVFGTKAGAAQRNLQAAQQNQQAAQDQAAANQANANLVNAQQAAQQILKTLQNDITKTKVGNVVKSAGKTLANGVTNAAQAVKNSKFAQGAKNLAKAGAAVGSRMMGGNEIDQQNAANAVDNVTNAVEKAAKGVKDFKGKVSNAAHGSAETKSEQKNAEKQQQKQQGGNK